MAGLTERQQRIRSKHVGASDLPAVCGVDEWRGPVDIWMKKTGRLDDVPSSEAAETGHRLEKALLDYAEERIGKKITRRNALRVHSKLPFMSCTHDGLVVTDPEGIQAKTTSSLDGWGDEMTDQVPDRVLVQVTAEMAVSDLARVWVPLLAATRNGFVWRMYVVDRHDRLVRHVENEAARFWECVKSDTPPEGTPRMETLKAITRTPGKTVEVPRELLAEYAEAQRIARRSEAARDEVKARLIAALGDAEIGVSEIGEARYPLITRKAYSVEAGSYRKLDVRIKKETESDGEQQADSAAQGAGGVDGPRLAAGRS